MPKEAVKDYSVQELKLIQDTISDDLMDIPCVNGIGIGLGSINDPEIGIRIFLEQTPSSDFEINELIRIVRKIPQDVPLSLQTIGEVWAL